jgi:hypothetical protein
MEKIIKIKKSFLYSDYSPCWLVVGGGEAQTKKKKKVSQTNKKLMR